MIIIMWHDCIMTWLACAKAYPRRQTCWVEIPERTLFVTKRTHDNLSSNVRITYFFTRNKNRKSSSYETVCLLHVSVLFPPFYTPIFLCLIIYSVLLHLTSNSFETHPTFCHGPCYVVVITEHAVDKTYKAHDSSKEQHFRVETQPSKVYSNLLPVVLPARANVFSQHAWLLRMFCGLLLYYLMRLRGCSL